METSSDMAVCKDTHGNLVVVEKKDLTWRPSVYGVIIRENEILLLPQFDDGYDFPGGGVDIGESFKDALNREIREETGLMVTQGPLLHVATTLWYSNHHGTAFQSIVIYYACSNPQGKISSTGFDVHERKYARTAEWVPLSRIDDLKFYNHIDSPALIKQALAWYRERKPKPF